MKMKINNYIIRFNPIFNEFVTSHPEVGTCESFKTLQEAIRYCLKG